MKDFNVYMTLHLSSKFTSILTKTLDVKLGVVTVEKICISFPTLIPHFL